MHSFKIIANHLDDSKKAASLIKNLLVDAGWKEVSKNYADTTEHSRAK